MKNYKNGKYLLQRGVPFGNNACKVHLIEKGILAAKLDLPIQPRFQLKINVTTGTC